MAEETSPTVLQLIKITNGFEIRRKRWEAQIERYQDQIRQLREALGLGPAPWISANPQDTQDTYQNTQNATATTATRSNTNSNNNNNQENGQQQPAALQDLQRQQLAAEFERNRKLANDIGRFSNREAYYTDVAIRDDRWIQLTLTSHFRDILDWGLDLFKNKAQSTFCTKEIADPDYALDPEVRERFERVGGRGWRRDVGVGSLDNYRFYLLMAVVFEWIREALLEPFMGGIEREGFNFDTLFPALRGSRAERCRWKKDTVRMLLANDTIIPKVTARAHEVAATIASAISPFTPAKLWQPSTLQNLRTVLVKLALSKVELEKEPFPMRFVTYPPGTRCDARMTYITFLPEEQVYNGRIIAFTVYPSVYRELPDHEDRVCMAFVSEAMVYIDRSLGDAA